MKKLTSADLAATDLVATVRVWIDNDTHQDFEYVGAYRDVRANIAGAMQGARDLGCTSHYQITRGTEVLEQDYKIPSY